MLTKTEQNCKNLKLEFKKKKEKKWSGDMVNRYLPIKFGLYICSGLQKHELTDDGRTADGRRTPWPLRVALLTPSN